MVTLNKTKTLSGKSWTNYTFNLYTIDTSFNSVKAIYFVSKRTNEGFHTILYIWQTDDLKTRFINHHKQTCFNKNWWNCIWVMQVPKQSDRDLIEEDLISNYKPTCNEQLT